MTENVLRAIDAIEDMDGARKPQNIIAISGVNHKVDQVEKCSNTITANGHP